MEVYKAADVVGLPNGERLLNVADEKTRGDLVGILVTLETVKNPRPDTSWTIDILIDSGPQQRSLRLNLPTLISASDSLDEPIFLADGQDPTYKDNSGVYRARDMSRLNSLLFFKDHLFWVEPSPRTSSERGAAARRVKEIVSAEKEASEPVSIDSLLTELDKLIGLEPVKREVRSLVNYLRIQKLRQEQGLPCGQMTLHLVFTGNPGTGKTTVARLLAKMYRAMGFLPDGHLVETDRSGLVAGYIGQTALKTSEVVQRAIGGVLFIDEAYALARTGEAQESDSFGLEAIDTLLKAMEDNRDRLVVIVAGYTEPMRRFISSNPGLESRFTRYIAFPDYSPTELMQIFEAMVSTAGYALSDCARKRAAVAFSSAVAMHGEAFGNGRFVRNIFERACVMLSDRLASKTDLTRHDLTIIEEADINVPSE